MDEWLQGVANWLNTLSIHTTVQDVEWVVPTVQTLHIIGVAIVFPAALILALRGLELVGTHWSLARWYRRFHGPTVAALWLLLATGLVMILAEPERELLNWIFRAKMVTIIVTLVIVSILGRRLRDARADRPAGAGARALAVLVLLLWIGVAIAGRWIAYAG